MEPIIMVQDKWSHSPLVALYLFFGGLTGGIFIVAALADLVGIRFQRFRSLSRVAALLAVPTLVLAGIFITAHLGKPERGMAFTVFFTNYESWMARGGWFVGATGPVIVLYAALWWFEVLPRVRRILGIVGIPLAVGLAMYTGALLAGAKFVPLWSMKYLPYLFLNSGLTTGIAAAGFVFALVWPFLRISGESSRPVVGWLSAMLVLMIGLELFELYSFMTYLASNPGGKGGSVPTGVFVAPAGSRQAYELVTGSAHLLDFDYPGKLAPWFWWGVVWVGLVIPLALTLPEFILQFTLRRWATPVATVKFAMVLVGGFLLRWVILHGGDLKAPLVFPPSKWPIPPAGPTLPPLAGLGG